MTEKFEPKVGDIVYLKTSKSHVAKAVVTRKMHEFFSDVGWLDRYYIKWFEDKNTMYVTREQLFQTPQEAFDFKE